MKCNEINIRDPFILFENGIYYMYGSRAKNFAVKSGGFDVYTSTDLVEWSSPHECFNSIEHNMNQGANWAPEVHKYNGKYYMFATFVQRNNLRGTYILRADSPLGPFSPYSEGAVTPNEWECLDGTFYVGQDNKPYIVFCHEHTQIIDGTICFARLSQDLTGIEGEIVTLFSASSCPYIDSLESNGHYVTDGPFLYRTKSGELFMIWSSFIKNQYAELLVRFEGGELGTNITHLPPIMDNDGGHGMVFKQGEKLKFVFHSPNTSGEEKPCFIELEDKGESISVK